MKVRERSVAGQILLLQILTVLLVVAVAVTLAYVDARRDQRDSARLRSVDIAETVADAPDVIAALDDPEPSATIQPFAERVRRDTGTDFVVVMALDRTRFSHPDPAQLGRAFIGDLGAAPEGRVFTQQYTGTLGPSMRAVVPVRDDGEVVALVSVGITLERIDRQLDRRLLPIVLAAGAVLAVGALGAWLISRRLRRQTHGLGAAEITRMYEYYDSVLHAVREGLLLIDGDGRVQLVNDEAARLLDTPADAVGQRVTEIGLPEPLAESLLAGTAGPDEIRLVGDRVLVVNQAEAHWEGEAVGSVVTLRDHTELQAVSGELDTVRGLAESLRAQNHEAANRLHTVVSLIELGRVDEAVEFATEELESAQLLTDTVVGSVGEPVVAAVLLGKSAQAAERGIELVIDEATRVLGLVVEPRDVVTILGNLLDNAFDAVAETEPRRVRVRVVADNTVLDIEVGDSGPGLPEGAAEQVFRHGWSTKRGDDAVGRGLGLALVGQVVRRHGGRIDAGTSDLGGARFTVHVEAPA
ncbi:MAG TPA: sensor histidine kinase [Nocardioides sp.]|uniref:sensor histidine kinase n=1 Tax=Nocardioides sp. TaxID=35761 RepID=UPI002D7FEE15|nr:sensor histidine kinase [Nocardioides sp.]HET6652538.1 sensor histidine kinase [Nocardioides sp.]